MKKQDVEALISRVMDMRPEGELKVCVEGERRLGTRFSGCAISQNSLRNQMKITLTARLEQKEASVTINSLGDNDTLKRAVEQTFNICKHMPDDEEVMPATGERLSCPEAAFDEKADTLEIEDLGKMAAKACHAGADAQVDLAGLLQVGKKFVAYGDSEGGFGFERFHRSDYHVTATGDNGSGWAEYEAAGVKPFNIEAATERAIKKCELAQNPVVYEPKLTTVILEPQAVGELLLMGFWYGFDQRSRDEGRSAFSEDVGKLGDLSVYSDPANKVFPTVSFTTDGQALKKDMWIDEGQVQQLQTNRYWAQKKDLVVKPRPLSLHMTGKGTSLDDMIANTEDGILVTRFWYIRSTDAKSLGFTGMTRDGIFRIVNGRLDHPVVDMRWNESLLNVLRNVQDSGQPESTGEFVEMSVPTLKVDNFQFTSLSN